MPLEYSLDFDPTDLDLARCVSSGQVFRWREVSPGTWEGVDGDNWFQVDLSNQLSVTSNAPEDQFRSLFRLDWDGAEVRRKIIERGPELEQYIVQIPGLRVMRPSSASETFFSFMCTPNNHVNRIASMIRTLAAFGEPLPSRPDLPRFPTIDRIADLPESELREKGFGYRGASIPKAAAQLLSLGGEPYLQHLKEIPYGEAHKALVEIHGIGPKLADCIALFALDHSEAVPIDTHIWQAATRVYFPEWKGTSLTAAKYQAIGEKMRERFGELAGWAHQYLFFENLLNWRSRK